MKKNQPIREGNKRHLKYFNRSDDLRLLGTILMGAGGVLFVWTWYMLWSYALYVLSFILLPIGIILFVLGSVGKSTEEDIDGVISRLSTAAEIDKEKDATLIRRQLKKPTPEVISGYDYSDGLMFRKAKSGIVRSEVFKKATILPLTDSLYVSSATVHIPCESVETEFFEFPYGEIEELRIVSERKTICFAKKNFSVNDSRFEIISHGNIVLSLPAKESATLDTFIQELNAQIHKS